MEFVCRAGRLDDMPRLLEIEQGATPGLLYLEDVKDEFFDPNKGELIVAGAGGRRKGKEGKATRTRRLDKQKSTA